MAARRSPIRDALAALGVGATSVELWEHGARNSHWLARTGDGDVVVSRFERGKPLASIRHQIEVMRWFCAAGWPTAEPVALPVEVGGVAWAAFRRLPGRPRSPRTEASIRTEQRSRGHMIARFHDDARASGALGQRPGALRADQLADREPSHDDVFRRWEARLPDEMRIVRACWDRARETLAALDAACLPTVRIHGDFTPWNLLWTNRRLTGLLDFEFSQIDLRVAEFAHSWRGRHEDIVRGYLEMVDLDDRERAAIVPVRLAWIADGTRRGLLRAGDARPNLEWAMDQLARRSPLVQELS